MAVEIKEPIQIHKSLIPDQHYDLILQINGDSMEPMFKDGEYVFIRKTEHIKSVLLNTEYEDLVFDNISGIILIGTVVL